MGQFEDLVNKLDTSIDAITAAVVLNTAALTALKTTQDSIAADSSAPNGKLTSAALDHASFVDGTDATCKINTALTVPAGCIAVGAKLEWTEAPTVDGSAGETDVTATIGDATGGDVDRLGAAMATVLATGLPAEMYDSPVGDAVYSAATAVWLHLTFSGGTPDASNFIAAGGSGKAVVTILYRNLSAL